MNLQQTIITNFKKMPVIKQDILQGNIRKSASISKINPVDLIVIHQLSGINARKQRDNNTCYEQRFFHNPLMKCFIALNTILMTKET